MAQNKDVLADFKAKALTPDLSQSKPVSTRIILNNEQLVVALSDNEYTIPVYSISTLNRFQVPKGVLTFVEDAVMIQYVVNSNRKQIIIGGDGSDFQKFTKILYNLIIRTESYCIHPYKKGGRVIDTNPKMGQLKITDNGLSISNSGSVTIPPEIVIGYSHERKEINGSRDPAIIVNQFRGDTVVSTVISVQNSGRLDILSQYLRNKYEQVHADFEGLEITRDEKQILLSIYSTIGDNGVSVESIVQSGSESAIDRLEDKGMIRMSDVIKLTHRGCIAIEEYLEDIN